MLNAYKLLALVAYKVVAVDQFSVGLWSQKECSSKRGSCLVSGFSPIKVRRSFTHSYLTEGFQVSFVGMVDSAILEVHHLMLCYGAIHSSIGGNSNITL